VDRLHDNSVTIYIHIQDDQIEKNEMSGECDACGEAMCMQGFDWETGRK